MTTFTEQQIEKTAFLLETYASVEDYLVRPGDGGEGLVIDIVPDLDYLSKQAGARKYIMPNQLELYYLSEGEPEYFYKDIFEDDSYTNGVLQLEEESIIFDVGANVGYFSLYASQLINSYKIFAFEPAPPVFDVLSLNMFKHNLNVTNVPVGLADREGKSSFTYYPRNSGYSTFSEDIEEEKKLLKQVIVNQLVSRDQGNKLMGHTDNIVESRFEKQIYECQIKTLSQIIDAYQVPFIDLLKIDVEKLEHKVLSGIETRHFPLIRQIVVEVHNHDQKLDFILDLLSQNGFEATVMQDNRYEETVMHSVYAKNNSFVKSAINQPIFQEKAKLSAQIFPINQIREHIQTSLFPNMKLSQFQINLIPG